MLRELLPLGVLLLSRAATASEYIIEHSSVHNCCVNKTFRVSMWESGWEPLYVYDSSLTERYKGYFVGLLDAVTTEMGMTLKLVDITDNTSDLRMMYAAAPAQPVCLPAHRARTHSIATAART